MRVIHSDSECCKSSIGRTYYHTEYLINTLILLEHLKNCCMMQKCMQEQQDKKKS